ncbi:unnamed protein product [Sphenostylis stenocarpa]|uniref:Uncharacterized protein n=1 Tax=Sphenostylis stenocarpa TaxID=92480 RepID=A0AA86SA75_9FABA|nr:unnamed protein product [Sphenostylis stenocarpa]
MFSIVAVGSVTFQVGQEVAVMGKGERQYALSKCDADSLHQLYILALDSGLFDYVRNFKQYLVSTLHHTLLRVMKQPLEFGELEWLADVGLFGEQFPQEPLAAAEVPQLPVTHTSNVASHKAAKCFMSYKKPRIEVLDEDEEEHFTVPDLGKNT